MAVEARCTNEEKVKLTAMPTTSAGTPATLDGPLRVRVVSGDGTGEQMADGDPNSVWLISGTATGDTIYVVEGDADLGPDEVLVPETVTLHVGQAMASNLGLVESAPVPK